MAMNFVAASSMYVLISDIIGTIGTTSTVTYWIKTTQVGDNTHWMAPGITGVEESGGSNDIFPGWIDASGFIGTGAANGPFQKSLAAINDDAWHHIACVYLVAGTAKLYVDGVLQGTSGTGAGPITTSVTSFGRQEDTGGSPNYYDGDLDDIRIYNRELSAAEVQTMYSAQGTDGIADGRISRWTLLEGAPGVVAAGAGGVKDVAPGANNGAGTNSPTYQTGLVGRRRRKVA